MILSFVMLWMMTACINEGMNGSDLRAGDEVPEFEVGMNDGSMMSDVDLKGSVSVIMFFHTTCPDCQKALPAMQEIYDEYASKGVVFVLVSRSEGKEEVESYWVEEGLKMPYSAQNDRTVYEKFAKTGIPRIYINDRNGIIRYIFADNPVPEYDDLKSALNSLV